VNKTIIVVAIVLYFAIALIGILSDRQSEKRIEGYLDAKLQKLKPVFSENRCYIIYDPKDES